MNTGMTAESLLSEGEALLLRADEQIPWEDLVPQVEAHLANITAYFQATPPGTPEQTATLIHALQRQNARLQDHVSSLRDKAGETLRGMSRGARATKAYESGGA